MSTGDVLVLDELLKQKHAELAPSLSKEEFFEFFTADKLLRDFDLDDDELQSGMVRGPLDGGIDSLYFFANGQLIQDDTDISTLKKNVGLELVAIQAKTENTFGETPIQKLIAVTEELLNPSVELDLPKLTSTFNERLLQSVNLFRERYRSLVSKFPTLTISYYYVTKGDAVHPNVQRKADLLKQKVNSLFPSDTVCNVHFIGAKKLKDLAFQAPKSEIKLTVAESFSSQWAGQIGYICLVSLPSYYRFIADEDGKLSAYL